MTKFHPGQCVSERPTGDIYYVTARYPAQTYPNGAVGCETLELVKRSPSGHLSTDTCRQVSHFYAVTSRPDAVILRAWRGDYKHMAVIVGKRMIIIAGCRTFTSFAAARKHWTNRRRNNRAYDRYCTVWTVSSNRRYRKVNTYNTPIYKKRRAMDRKLNTFSLNFVKLVERAMAAQARAKR